jgi:hypothetical protein
MRRSSVELCAAPGLRARPTPTSTTVTFQNGRDGDICIWWTHNEVWVAGASGVRRSRLRIDPGAHSTSPRAPPRRLRGHYATRAGPLHGLWGRPLLNTGMGPYSALIPGPASPLIDSLPVLLPQQHQGDAGTAQLMTDMGPVRLGLAPRAAVAAGAGIEHRLQNSVAQRCRQRPAKLRRRQAIEGYSHHAARNPQRSGDRPVGRAALLLEARDLSYASHRHSLGWHRSPPVMIMTSKGASPAQWSSDRHPRVAEFKSESPSSNRNRWPTSFRNQWPACSGISSPMERVGAGAVFTARASYLGPVSGSVFSRRRKVTSKGLCQQVKGAEALVFGFRGCRRRTGCGPSRCGRKDAHRPGSPSDFAKTPFDGVGGSDPFAFSDL